MKSLSSEALKLSLSKSSFREAYLKSLHLRILFGVLLFLLIMVVVLLSLAIGSLKLTFEEVVSALLRTSENSFVVWNIRLPRVVGALLCGASLGVAGGVLQNVLRNPLASPFTLGVSQGAAFGAAFAIIVLSSGMTFSTGNQGVLILKKAPVVLFAFIGALSTTLIVFFLAFIKRLTPEAIVLSGVAISSLFSSATMFLQYFAQDFQVAATVFWTFGDLGKAGWSENGWMFLIFSFVFLYFILHRWDFNALSFGDEVAKSLGVAVSRFRLTCLFLSALLVSVCTAFLGIIGFVGLISPHLVRLLMGSDYRFLLPYSALMGALLLALADLAARTLLAPVILPVGILTSFIGAPLFFYLLLRYRKNLHA